METETIAARNVVELLMQEEYGASICKSAPAPETPPETKKKAGDKEKEFIYGWDC